MDQIEVHPYLAQDDVRQFWSGQDFESIRSLNRGERTGPDPDKFDVV